MTPMWKLQSLIGGSSAFFLYCGNHMNYSCALLDSLLAPPLIQLLAAQLSLSDFSSEVSRNILC